MGSSKTDGIPAPTCQISEVYKEALNCAQLHNPRGYSQYHVTVSRLCPWNSLWEQERHIPRTGVGVGILRVPMSSSQVSQQSPVFNDTPQPDQTL